MHEDWPHPYEEPAPDELSDSVRRAVDHVRRQPVPQQSLNEALNYALDLEARSMKRSTWWTLALAATGVAATIVLAVSLLFRQLNPEATPTSPSVAVLDTSKSMPGDAKPRDGDLTNGYKMGDKEARTNYHVERPSDSSVPITKALPSRAIGNPTPPTTPPSPLPGMLPGAVPAKPPADSYRGSAPQGRDAESRRRPLPHPTAQHPREENKDEAAPSRDPGAPRLNDRLFPGERNAATRKAWDQIVGGQGGGGGQTPLQRQSREKLKQLEDSWGKLPERDRVRALEEVARELPESAKKVVSEYFKSLSGKPETDPAKKPQVWKQTGRPSFARVYVGDGNSLELVSLHVTVTVEGPRARTLVDHVFRNPHARQLEGTFEYPLPTGASPSYFAMFLGQTRNTVPPLFARRGDVPALSSDAIAQLAPNQVVRHVNSDDWGRLQEARVVSNQKALETYEEVVRGRIDPALLQYAGGNTFRGRVFPIPPSGYNRVLIAYEETLTPAGQQSRYAFPLPDCQLTELGLTLSAGAADCLNASFQPGDAKKVEGGGRLSFTRTWVGEGPGGDAAFTFTPPQPQVQAISGRHGGNGPNYLYARVRPDLKVQQAAPFAKQAVFLLDTSLSEHPARFDLSMKLLRAILEADSDLERFNVLTFNVGCAWLEPKAWLKNTPADRDKVFARLDGLILEGATDFGAALDELASGSGRPPLDRDSKLDVFVLSDGQITWGENETGTLVSRFEARCPNPTRFQCYRTGLGADNLELYTALTRRGGGIFNCFTAEDLAAAAKAHRSQCLQVQNIKFVGGPAASDVLIAGRRAAVYPGGDLVVAAKMNGTSKTQVLVEGTFLGQKYAQEYPIEVRGDSELASRGWGEIAVASLLALNDPKLEALATAYCQEFGVGSRVASFLVLENENDYKRFNLEEERGKTLAGDLGKFLDKAWTNLGQLMPARESFLRFLNSVDARVKLLSGENGAHVSKLLNLLKDGDFELPGSMVSGALLRRSDVPPAYLAARERDVSAYLTEARRRTNAQDADGAVRVLSSIIEEHPGRDDALRLVGYRLLDLKQPAQAARLFGQVQRQRPFEPHSYRDLARSLEESSKYGLAAVQYEIVLAGTWHTRFRDSLKEVVREEYAQMMREAIHRKILSKDVADHFGNRLEGLTSILQPRDLRVTISWNTDATDVDLWVMEPDGTKCFYQNQKTKSGGELSQDQTQGYGPERYQTAKAAKGIYRVMVHYFRANANLLAGETHVNVVVARHAGTPQEVVQRHTVILKKHGEAVEVCQIEY